MLTFLLSTWKLLRALFDGIRKDSEFRSLMALFLLILLSGTFFYCRREGWDVIDSLYFCVMTMSTIGYGDLAPTHKLSKIFTMVYAFLSIGLFVAINSKIVAIILNRQKNKHKSVGAAISRMGKGRVNK